jgi:hypothetical protein
VLSEDGRVEVEGHFEELVKINEYIQSLAYSKSSEDDFIEQESGESVIRPEGAQEAKPEPREITKRTKTPRGGGDISLYTYYIGSFGWWVFGLTLVFASLFVFCISFPRECPRGSF